MLNLMRVRIRRIRATSRCAFAVRTGSLHGYRTGFHFTCQRLQVSIWPQLKLHATITESAADGWTRFTWWWIISWDALGLSWKGQWGPILWLSRWQGACQRLTRDDCGQRIMAYETFAGYTFSIAERYNRCGYVSQWATLPLPYLLCQRAAIKVEQLP